MIRLPASTVRIRLSSSCPMNASSYERSSAWSPATGQRRPRSFPIGWAERPLWSLNVPFGQGSAPMQNLMVRRSAHIHRAAGGPFLVVTTSTLRDAGLALHLTQ